MVNIYKKNPKTIFLCLLIFVTFFLQVKGQNSVQAFKSTTLIVDDFSQFELHHENPSIISGNAMDWISFEYAILYSDYGIHENYIMKLNDYGNCSGVYKSNCSSKNDRRKIPRGVGAVSERS